MKDVRQVMDDRKVCVVVPTYNNAGTIVDVLRRTAAFTANIIVVIDGCTDDTRERLRELADIPMEVVDYAENKGKGHALLEGFKHAISRGYEYAITLDSDGQHFPEDIPNFIEALELHPEALIVGARNLNEKNMPGGNTFANRFSNFWFTVQTGIRLPDTQTGYRLYPLRLLSGMWLITSRYEAELELLVLASWHGVELVPVDIRVYYPPQAQRVSHFRPGRDFARISLLNVVLCFLTVVYGLPLRLYRSVASVVRTLYSVLFVLFFCFCIITPAVWLYIKVGKMTEKKRKKLHSVIFHATRFVMLKHGIPGTTFKYKMSDKVDFGKPSVIICNHQSHLDLACQLIFTPNVVFLTNQWVWNNPLYGLLIRHAEFYPVADGIDNLMPKLRSLAERGYSIAVYPEGTRSKDCTIGRFHQGAFHIAEQLQADIIPMYLYGPGKILPKKTHRLHKGPIYIEIGDPITPDMLRQMGDTRAQASTMRKHYIRKYEMITNAIERDV